jgi:glycosyltransferase involved in cell wall biosynthesis
MLFTSTRQEWQGFTMVEALLAGCAVVTTGSGGAMEVATLARLPVFPKDDPVALGALLAPLVMDRRAVREIAAHGQKVAMQEFDAEHMINKLESTLLRFTGTPQEARAVRS